MGIKEKVEKLLSYKTFSHTPVPLKSYVPPVTTDGSESPKHC